MHTPNRDLGQRGYETDHIDTVLTAIRNNFNYYWSSFEPAARERFRDAISAWEHEHGDYVSFLDAESLQEYEDDPNAFKSTMRAKCPIVRSSLFSPAEEMKKYRQAFNAAKGRDLLTTTLNIVEFATQYIQTFNGNTHEQTEQVDELGLADLLEERYGVYGAIGGGIRSQFLFSLYPSAFPYRSRAAVWALYFLSGKSDFGFDDASEFLMINVEKSSVQQNYFYPYDLFAFYSLKVFSLIKEASAIRKLPLDSDRRYVYLDAFFNHVHDRHQEEIKLLKGDPEDEYAD